MFLESLISTSNLPKPMQMYHRQFWQNRLPALTKLYTGFAKSFACIGGIVYQNCRIWHCIHINYAYPYCRHSKSFTGIGEIVNQYWWNHMPVLMKLYTSIRKKLTFSSFWFHQYLQTILSILVNDFINIGIRFFQYLWTISECQQKR